MCDCPPVDRSFFDVNEEIFADFFAEGQKKMKLVRFGVLEKMDWSVRCVSLQELTKENNAKTVLIEQNKLMELKKKVSGRELKSFSNIPDTESWPFPFAERNRIGLLHNEE